VVTCVLFLLFIFSLALTKLDVLDTFPEILVGVAYKTGGKLIDYFPSNQSELGTVEVRFYDPMWIRTKMQLKYLNYMWIA
jgi:adenylosuccinate synthase